jgi:hypothetical protein
MMFLLFSLQSDFEYRVNLLRKKKEEGQKHGQKGLIVTLIGHGESCQCNYNLVFMKGAAVNHGEFVETIWSHSTTLATASRENGPHVRQASLNEHWAGWDWCKVVGLCKWQLFISR